MAVKFTGLNYNKKSFIHRRNFIKGMAAAAGLSLSAGLVACGDNTNTAAPAATSAPTTTVAATTAVAATTQVATTAAASATTAAASTTAAAASGAEGAPAGYTQVGQVPTDAQPVSFTSGSVKGYIYAKSSSEVTVFSDKCTHKGCDVPYVAADKKFECPCHGSQYDPSGVVIKGPATGRLPLFDSKVVGQVVYAKLS